MFRSLVSRPGRLRSGPHDPYHTTWARSGGKTTVGSEKRAVERLRQGYIYGVIGRDVGAKLVCAAQKWQNRMTKDLKVC